MRNRKFTALVEREKDIYISKCLEFDMYAEGNTAKNSIINLRKRIEERLGAFDDDTIFKHIYLINIDDERQMA